MHVQGTGSGSQTIAKGSTNVWRHILRSAASTTLQIVGVTLKGNAPLNGGGLEITGAGARAALHDVRFEYCQQSKDNTKTGGGALYLGAGTVLANTR